MQRMAVWCLHPLSMTLCDHAVFVTHVKKHVDALLRFHITLFFPQSKLCVCTRGTGSEWVDPEDPTVIAETELLGAAASIEAAAKKLEQLKPRAKPKVSEYKEVKERSCVPHVTQ